MGEAHRNKVANASGISLGIVAPDGRDAMIQTRDSDLREARRESREQRGEHKRQMHILRG